MTDHELIEIGLRYGFISQTSPWVLKQLLIDMLREVYDQGQQDRADATDYDYTS